MRTFLGAILALAALNVGCASSAEQTAAESRNAIVGGEIDPGHPAAVAITFIFPKPNGKLGAVTCSGAIFAVDGSTGYVLTAAHCLLPNPGAGVPQPVPNEMHVIEGSDFGCFISDQTGSSCTSPVHSVTAIDADPGFAQGASPPLAGHDLGVISIDGCGPTTPTLPILTTDSMTPGTPVDIVGFGELSASSPPLTNTTKYHGSNTLAPDFDSATTVGIFQSASGPGGTCDGDSGGPWIANFSGTDYIGAVTSVGHQCATSSIAARVSAGLDNFLAPYLPAATGTGGSSGASSGGAAGGAQAPVPTAAGDSGGCAVTRAPSHGAGPLALAVFAISLRRRRVRIVRARSVSRIWAW